MLEEKKAFDTYVNGFDFNNNLIKLKYYHTLMVTNISNIIASNLKLDKEDVYLATLIGLLHDIGRFEEAKKFNTFKDTKMDHAMYGSKLLFKDNLIRNFIKDNKYDEIIKFAIENHNKYKIEECSDKKMLMFAKIIRDADKIDIFRVIAENNKNIFDCTPSKKVLEDFNNNMCINKKDIKNNADIIMSRLGFIYDINYVESLKVLKNTKNLDEFIDSIIVDEKYKEQYKQLKNKIYNYIDERIEQYYVR